MREGIATDLSSCAVGRNGGNILNTTNLHACTSQSTQSRLSTWARGLGASSTGGTHFDVEGCDSNFLAASSNILSSQHGSVGRRFITISLDLHAAYGLSNRG